MFSTSCWVHVEAFYPPDGNFKAYRTNFVDQTPAFKSRHVGHTGQNRWKIALAILGLLFMKGPIGLTFLPLVSMQKTITQIVALVICVT